VSASIERLVDSDSDSRRVLRCPEHGITDDMVLVEHRPGHYRYVCRLCQTKPCEIHGWDYVTVIRVRHEHRQVCIICEPEELTKAAERMNRARRRAAA